VVANDEVKAMLQRTTCNERNEENEVNEAEIAAAVTLSVPPSFQEHL
jgi:hypothetical protein